MGTSKGKQDEQSLQLIVPDHDAVTYTYSAEISTITLVSGWTEKSTQLVKAAVKEVYKQNPFLGASLKQNDEGKLICTANAHDELVVEIDGPADFTVSSGLGENINKLQTELEPLFRKHTIGDANAVMANDNPMFRVILMSLPENHMAYVIELSHVHADGATYYKVIDALNAAVNSRPIPQLTWTPASLDVMYPETFSEEERLFLIGGWAPGYVKMCEKYAEGTEGERVVTNKIISKTAVGNLKKQYAEAATNNGLKFLSTNDFVTAGLMELSSDDGVGIMYANMRGRMPGVSSDFAGNYERPIWIPSKKAQDPCFIRGEVLNNFNWFGCDGNPSIMEHKSAVEACDVNCFTNWASLTAYLEPPQTSVICHCCTSNFVRAIHGIDMTVVYQAHKDGTLGLCSNLLEGMRGDEVAERYSRSTIFQHLFEGETMTRPALQRVSSGSQTTLKLHRQSTDPHSGEQTQEPAGLPKPTTFEPNETVPGSSHE